MRRSNRRFHKALYGLCVGAGILFIPGVWWGLPAYESWSPDAIAPVGPAYAVVTRFARSYVYGPFAYVLPALAQAPYYAWLSITGAIQPPFHTFPYGLANPLASLTTLTVLVRVLSVMMSMGFIFAVTRATHILTRDRRIAFFASCAACVNAYVVLFAKTSNVDMHSAFWLAWAVYAYARLLTGAGARMVVVWGVVAVCAEATKETAYSAVAGMGCVLAWEFLRERKQPRLLVLAFATVVVTYLLLHNVLFDWDGYLTRADNLWFGPTVNQYATYPPTLAGYAGLYLRTGQRLVQGWGWPMVGMCVAGIGLAVRTRRRLLCVLGVPALAYLMGTIGAMHWVHGRFTIPLLPFLAPLAAVGLAAIVTAPRGPACARGGAVALVVVVSVAWSLRPAALMLADARYAVEDYLRENVSRTATVEVYSGPRYVPRLREMGYSVRTLPPKTTPPSAFTVAALARRAPDIIVASPRDVRRGTGSYIRSIYRGEAGYSFRRFTMDAPAWAGFYYDRIPFITRLGYPLWVFERSAGPNNAPAHSPAEGEKSQ